MNIGDPVKVTGTIKDIVHVKESQSTSILVQTDDLPGAPGKELWFQEAVVQANPPVEPAAETSGTAKQPAPKSTAGAHHA